ncbi:MAG: alpha/beta hydrolase [Bacteroidota bacterium]
MEAVSIKSGEVTLSGHLHIPNEGGNKTALILVGGRGCYAGATQYDLYAKVLRRYGVSVLAYQKRGTGNSTGDCGTATISDLADDVIAVKKYLENHPNGYENIGVLGMSAGGWTMTKAAESTDFDFMISIVGPSTSVRDQQLQSMRYGADLYGVKGEALENVTRYTNLMFDAEANAKGFEKMEKLLASAADENWKDLLEDTDVAPDAEELDNLWVRRHNYDPKDVLSNYKKPFLAIYGQRDWIVPYKENIELLEKYFTDRKENLTTVVAYGAEHGMEMESKWVELENGQSYWHFFRISPQVKIELVNFLRGYDFIE